MYGLHPDYRSKLMATESEEFPDIEGSGDVWAAATVVESCYLASEMEPENDHVQLIIRDGIPGGLWDGKMPADVITFCKNEANEHAQAAGFTFMDGLNEVEGAEAQWVDHALENKIVKRWASFVIHAFLFLTHGSKHCMVEYWEVAQFLLLIHESRLGIALHQGPCPTTT